MSLISEIRHRLRGLFQRTQVEQDRAEEFQFHLEQQSSKYRQQGLPPDEARRRALLEFGNVAVTTEAVRDARGTRWVEDTISDLRYALRRLWRSPVFTAVAVITLALGIGANTAIYSVVDGVLLRPVRLADAEQLVVVWETDRASGTTREPASWPDFVDFKRQSRSLAGMAALTATDVSLVPDRGEPARVAGAQVTHDYLELVGIKPLLGRGPTAAEDQPNGPKVVLLGEGLWRTRFNADPAVLGRTIRLNDQPFEIIGVMPHGADFGLDQINARAAYHATYSGEGEIDVWTPMQASQEQLPRDTHPLFVVGRLGAGASVDQAQSELADIAAQLERAYPSNADRGVHVESLREVTFGPVRPVLVLLLSAAVLVLLVACVNVANLLLARGARRTREIAMRAALGAGLGRLGRQFVVETVILTLVGGAVGILVARLGLKALLALAPAEVPRVTDVSIDGRVLAATLIVSVLVGLGFGLVPTLQSLRLDVMNHIKSDSVSGGSGRHRHRVRGALVVTELALSVMLVLSAGLLIRSFQRVMHINPGFQTEGILKAQYELPPTRYPRDFSRFPNWTEVQGFASTLIQKASQIPGVTSAAIASAHPLDRGFTNSWSIVGRPSDTRFPEISLRAVSPGYFATMGLHLQRGRLLEEGDGPTTANVGVLNETAVRRFFGDTDPVGQEIQFWGRNRRVVGVVSDEKIHGLTEETPPAVYVSLGQAPMPVEVLLVRTAGPPEDLAQAVRQSIWSIDPELAIYGVEPLDRTVLASVGQRRFAMLVLTVFAGVTLMLALVGIYGVLSYTTEQRTREIGIRSALGADRRQVVGLVLRQGVLLALIGTGIGLGGAYLGSRLLQSLLFGVTRLDPLTHLIVPALVLVAAVAAMWTPAWRASRISPIEALRQE